MIEFEEFRLDPVARTLHRGAEELRLSPKLFDLLVLLIERHGTTVDKDEILRVVWPGVVVEESGLARNVSLLRKALGEEDGSRFIVTVPKRGYRFVAPLRDRAATPEILPAAAVVVPRWRLATYSGLAAILVVAAVAVFPGFRHSPPTSPAILPLTTHAAEQAVDAAAITADGSYFAWYDLTGLFVRPTGSQESRRIELPAALFPTQLEWFPDKAHLLLSAFDSSLGKSSAWIIPVLGGAPALLHEDASYATVSPDGRQIAFMSKSSQIWLANADGSGARLFAALPATDRIAGRLQFTADGAQLLNGRAVMDQEGAIVESRRLTDGAVTQLLELPHFAIDFLLLPRGELVVSRFTDVNSIDMVLEQYHVDPLSPRAGAGVTLARYPAAWIYGLSATADGGTVTFVRDPAQSDVYIADLDDTGTAIANVRRLTFDEARDRPTAWAPDSRHVVFHSNRGGKWNVYLQAIDEPGATLLTPGAGNHVWTAISADQKWLLYMAGEDLEMSPDNDYDLMRKPLAGGPAELVSARRGTVFRRVRCARMGERCVLMERVGKERVFYSLDPERGIGAELARTGWGPDWFIDWDLSPTGDRIAAIDASGLRNRITVISLGDKPVTTNIVVPGFQALLSLNWDHEGAGFYVASTDSLAGGLLHVKLDGTTTYLRREIDGDSWAIPSPDGKHLAILEWTIAGNVWEIRRAP